MKNIILIIILSLVLLSCKKDDDSSSTNTELEGTWVVSCYDDDDDGVNYLIKTITVTGTELVEKIEVHTDSSCTTDKDSWETTYSSLSIGDSLVFSTYGASGGTGHKFTMTLSTKTYTPHTSALVSASNTDSFCGETGWELNTAKDVVGKTCFSSAYNSAGHAYYGMYILDGTKLMPNISSSSYPSSVSSADSNTYNKQ